jgi:uncharacterized protein YuzE
MKITYDPKADAMYITLVDGDHELRTERLSEEIALDFAPGDVLVGIEILDASEILGYTPGEPVVLENIPALQSAASKIPA